MLRAGKSELAARASRGAISAGAANPAETTSSRRVIFDMLLFRGPRQGLSLSLFDDSTEKSIYSRNLEPDF